MFEELRKKAIAADGKEQFAVHEKYYELTDRVSTQMTIAKIRYDGDTADEFYSRENDYYNEKKPIYRNLVLEYEKRLSASPFRDFLEAQSILKNFKKRFFHCTRFSRHFQ